MKFRKQLLLFLLLCISFSIIGQKAIIEGYVFETGNRGFIDGVSITVENMSTEKIIGKTRTDKDGHFSVSVPEYTKVRLYASKDMYDIKRLETEVETGKMFIKMEMGRSEGYTFEVTLAEKKSFPNEVVDAISGARIEVYNNTQQASVMDLKDHDFPTFQLNLEKGNHYTILIRKTGFLSKRMEVKVDVEDCILCFEGVGDIEPGVSDNLTENNAFGVLLANVELERIFKGKTMEVQNLYYDLGKWKLTGNAREELNKVIVLMKDNPGLTIELGSHTDSRGNAQLNQELSQKRARSAVNYLITQGGISKERITSKGYGEDQLTNHCSDGVECTEEEHANNRRTELKIVGITDVTEIKSLALMKKEAQMEAQLLSLTDQEEIRARNEEELKSMLEIKEALKAQTNPEKKTKDNTDTTGFSQKMTPEIIKPIQQDIPASSPVKNDLPSMVDSIGTKTPNLEEESSPTPITEPSIETITQEDEALSNKESLSQTKNKTGGINYPIAGEGIKVVVYQSEHALPSDHFIVTRHRSLEVYQNNEGLLYYLIGGFDSLDQARQFFRSFIKPDSKYKDPYVAKLTENQLKPIKD